MNNEEKILSMLESMKNDMNGMKNDMKDVKERLSNVEDKVLRINLAIENEIRPGIRLLAEGHKTLVDRLWHLPDEVEDIKESVSILKFVQEQMALNQNKQK